MTGVSLVNYKTHKICKRKFAVTYAGVRFENIVKPNVATHDNVETNEVLVSIFHRVTP
jgi:hypothetical protein